MNDYAGLSECSGVRPQTHAARSARGDAIYFDRLANVVSAFIHFPRRACFASRINLSSSVTSTDSDSKGQVNNRKPVVSAASSSARSTKERCHEPIE